jgi:hypothetical protein
LVLSSVFLALVVIDKRNTIALIQLSIYHRLYFHFNQIFIANQIGANHGIGGLNIFEADAVCAGYRFPIIYVSDKNTGSGFTGLLPAN